MLPFTFYFVFSLVLSNANQIEVIEIERRPQDANQSFHEYQMTGVLHTIQKYSQMRLSDFDIDGIVIDDPRPNILARRGLRDSLLGFFNIPRPFNNGKPNPQKPQSQSAQIPPTESVKDGAEMINSNNLLFVAPVTLGNGQKFTLNLDTGSSDTAS